MITAVEEKLKGTDSEETQARCPSCQNLFALLGLILSRAFQLYKCAHEPKGRFDQRIIGYDCDFRSIDDMIIGESKGSLSIELKDDVVKRAIDKCITVQLDRFVSKGLCLNLLERKVRSEIR